MPLWMVYGDDNMTFLYDRRLQQRIKQVGYGKETVGYQNYILQVPHHCRDPLEREARHPVTPRVDLSVSKRQFDASLRRWRRALHQWDPVVESDSDTDQPFVVPRSPPTPRLPCRRRHEALTPSSASSSSTPSPPTRKNKRPQQQP